MQINTVDLVWIDVQGAELNVFKGAKETLKNTKIIDFGSAEIYKFIIHLYRLL